MIQKDIITFREWVDMSGERKRIEMGGRDEEAIKFH